MAHAYNTYSPKVEMGNQEFKVILGNTVSSRLPLSSHSKKQSSTIDCQNRHSCPAIWSCHMGREGTSWQGYWRSLKAGFVVYCEAPSLSLPWHDPYLTRPHFPASFHISCAEESAGWEEFSITLLPDRFQQRLMIPGPAISSGVWRCSLPNPSFCQHLQLCFPYY